MADDPRTSVFLAKIAGLTEAVSTLQKNMEQLGEECCSAAVFILLRRTVELFVLAAEDSGVEIPEGLRGEVSPDASPEALQALFDGWNQFMTEHFPASGPIAPDPVRDPDGYKRAMIELRLRQLAINIRLNSEEPAQRAVGEKVSAQIFLELKQYGINAHTLDDALDLYQKKFLSPEERIHRRIEESLREGLALDKVGDRLIHEYPERAEFVRAEIRKEQDKLRIRR
jgi:hypothetical protein